MSKPTSEAIAKLLKPLAETAEVEYADVSLLAVAADNDLATRLPNCRACDYY